MYKAKELDINGVHLKSGNMTSQTRLFFESRGATIQDQDHEITLSGTFTVTNEDTDSTRQDQLQTSLFEQLNEKESLALEIISSGFHVK